MQKKSYLLQFFSPFCCVARGVGRLPLRRSLSTCGRLWFAERPSILYQPVLSFRIVQQLKKKPIAHKTNIFFFICIQ